MLTIFTGPKPFEGDIGRIQENAIGSWSKLHPDIQILLIGDEIGIHRFAEKVGARHLGNVLTNDWGTPLVDSMLIRLVRLLPFHTCASLIRMSS